MARKLNRTQIGQRGNEAKKSNFAFDTGEGKWEGANMETPMSDKRIDHGTGKEVVIRRFDFKVPTDFPLPTDKEFIEYHKLTIDRFLFKDGFEQIDSTRIKREKGLISLLVPCSVRKGEVILEKPKKLSEIIK